jgi:hypothetical protein
LSIRPSAGTIARSVGPLYTAMCNHANGYDGSVVPELHVTDLVKFRGPTAATSWTVGLTDTMLKGSIECLHEEYLAIAPPIILLVDWAGVALSDSRSPLHKTSALRLSWRSDPSTAHLDSLLSKIGQTGRPAPSEDKATRQNSWAPSPPGCTVTPRLAPGNLDLKLIGSVHPGHPRQDA